MLFIIIAICGAKLLLLVMATHKHAFKLISKTALGAIALSMATYHSDSMVKVKMSKVFGLYNIQNRYAEALVKDEERKRL